MKVTTDHPRVELTVADVPAGSYFELGNYQSGKFFLRLNHSESNYNSVDTEGDLRHLALDLSVVKIYTNMHLS